jgi:hypothetical protein
VVLRGTFGRLIILSVQLGVWLHPKELQVLFSLVDEDDGGDVDEEEFVRFWESH